MKTKLSILLVACLVLVFLLVPLAIGAPSLTSFSDHVHILTTGGTATPALMVNQKGTGKLFELRDNGTPVYSINDGGAARGYLDAAATPNKLENCWTATITGTASYTSNITALATPEFAWCNVTSPSADANVCGAAAGSGIVTITVRNSAPTPAANSAGATVYGCAKGTP